MGGVTRIPPWVDRFARGAGAVDMGVRGIAGGFVESVHGVAESARDVMRALVEGPRSCGQVHCAAAASMRCRADPCRRSCGDRKENSVAGANIPAPKSTFEVLNDPDEKIMYDASSFAAKVP